MPEAAPTPPAPWPGGLRLVVAGDVRLYRDGIAYLLADFPDLRVVATASDAASTRGALRDHEPHVLLVDMAMPDSLSLLHSLPAGAPPVVALALPEVESTFLTCVEAGMASYVPREATAEDLVSAIRGAVRGEASLDPRLTGSLLRRVSALSARMGSPEREFELTQREGEIARLIAEGKTNKRIAAELHIAVATVKNHVHRVLKKMGATRRSEVAVRWTRRTIREPPSLRSRRAVGHQPHSR